MFCELCSVRYCFDLVRSHFNNFDENFENKVVLYFYILCHRKNKRLSYVTYENNKPFRKSQLVFIIRFVVKKTVILCLGPVLSFYISFSI